MSLSHTISDDALFPLGRIVMTTNLRHTLDEAGLIPSFVAMRLLNRHVRGDWGDLSDDDTSANDYALEHGERLLSAYTKDGIDIWIITERDRSVTTLLLPEDY